MATAGYDYVLSGDSWADPSHITYSIPADGVFWDHGVNNLNATFNARFGAGVWERQFARALATWESVANISISPVADGNEDFDSLGRSQGDSRFGDIRLGGYPYNVSTTILAQTFFPPPNGSTAAGDFEANTSINFNIGSEYDLYSVALHEMGHALGLDHALNPSNIMYAHYQGVRNGLSDGDIVGIQAIYGPRTTDSYQTQGLGLSFSSSIDLTAGLARNLDYTIKGVSLPRIGSSEYYSFVVPANASQSLQITAAAANISMLSPKLSLYDGSGNLVAQASNSSAWSDNVTVTVPNVAPGQRYYVVVSGATGDYFDVGGYQLQVSLPGSISSNPVVSTSPDNPGSTSAPPSVPPLAIKTAATPDRYEPNNSFNQAVSLGRVSKVNLDHLSIDSATDQDYFRFKPAHSGSYQIVASGASISIFDSRGRLIAGGSDQLTINVPKRITSYVVLVNSSNHATITDYSVSIAAVHPTRYLQTHRSARRVIKPRKAAKPHAKPGSHVVKSVKHAVQPIPAINVRKVVAQGKSIRQTLPTFSLSFL